MNKKIKIIDLMQKCANKENIPERILYKNTAFVLNDCKCYYNEEKDERLLDYIIPTFSNLNEEVEILEDNTKEKVDDTKMNKKIKEGDTVRVRSTSVPKGFDFTYKYGIGSVGKVLSNAEHKDFRSVIVEFGNDVTERDSYYEDDLDLLEDNTEEIEELDKEWTYIEGQVEKTWSKSELEAVEKINELVKAINAIRKEKE